MRGQVPASALPLYSSPRRKIQDAVDRLLKALRDLRQLTGRRFTLDGFALGDLGETVASLWYGVELHPTQSHKGQDGTAPDGRSVEVKITQGNDRNRPAIPPCRRPTLDERQGPGVGRGPHRCTCKWKRSHGRRTVGIVELLNVGRDGESGMRLVRLNRPEL